MVLDVLFVSCEGRLGGAERSLLSLASALRHHESVAIACPQGSLLEKTADAWGVQAIGLPLSPAQPTPAETVYQGAPAAAEKALAETGQAINRYARGLSHNPPRALVKF